MIRLTHRLCRTETEGLADTAHRQTKRAEDLTVKVEGLADDLRATEHQLAEIKAACEDPEYTPEAVIPEYLRQRLLAAHQLPGVTRERDDALAQIDALQCRINDLEERDHDDEDAPVVI